MEPAGEIEFKLGHYHLQGTVETRKVGKIAFVSSQGEGLIADGLAEAAVVR
jgi:hypothetical protein